MHFEPTKDYARLRAVATHDKLWNHLSDDFAPPKDEWRPSENEALLYVQAWDGAEELGFFMLAPHSPVLYEIHTALLPCAWGERAAEAARGIVDWLWANTSCLRLITSVPASNRLALRFAKAAGMAAYGVNPASYMKRGKLEDLILLGLSRPAA